MSRNKWWFIIGVPLMGFALLPFPIGCGMAYPIRDVLRGHPQWEHGSHPDKFVGLWIREEAIEFDFKGQAFYLLPDGLVAGLDGMSRRRWHYDNDKFFTDSVSLCGNCYAGNSTSAFKIAFRGANEMVASNLDSSVTRGIGGTYRRFEVSDGLKANMKRLSESTDDKENSKGRNVLRVIERVESLAAFKKASP